MTFNSIQMPLDFQESNPFRRMAKAIDRVTATFMWVVLWRDLTYLAQEGKAPGRVEKPDQAMLAESLGDGEASIQMMIEAELLVKLADDTLVCPRFSAMNKGAVSGCNGQQLGGLMTGYSRRKNRRASQSVQMALMVEKENWRDFDGQTLDRDGVRRVMMLIGACDSALRRNVGGREKWMYTPEVISDATRVLRAYTDEEIDEVCKLLVVAYADGHPALCGLTTEKLLPTFKEVVGKVTG